MDRPQAFQFRFSHAGARRWLFLSLLLITAIPGFSQQGDVTVTDAEDRRRAATERAAVVVTGTVFEDLDGDGRYSPGNDRPLPGIGVSDGASVTLTDQQGRYALKSSPAPESVYVTQPAGFARRTDFFALIPRGAHAGTTESAKAGTRAALPRYGADFPLTRAPQPDPARFRFVHTADASVRGQEDRKPLAQAVREIDQLLPEVSFVVSTGHLADANAAPEAWKVLAEESRRSRLPWFHVTGAEGPGPRLLGPAWYSADFGNAHLVFLGGSAPGSDTRRSAWLEQDVKLLGRGRQVVAVLSDAPDAALLDQMRRLGIKAVFHSGTFSNQILGHRDGMAIVGQSPLLMGGLDGSPASFRIVTVDGAAMNSEFRVRGSRALLRFPYPQTELSGQERVMANIYDSLGGVSEARFRIAGPEGVIGEGVMKKVSPFTWMGSLDPKELGIRRLPPDFVVAVRARNESGDMWENGTRVVVPQRRRDRPAKVRTGGDWNQFMGSAQRTGVANDELTPPLRLVWATPTHGHIDLSSPVVFKGTVAIGVKDRDNLINNGVAMFDVRTGELTHFAKTDSMICGTPAFVEDPEDGPGRLYAVSGAASIYFIDPKTGKPEGAGRWRERGPGWVWASPATQNRLAVAGGQGGMMGLLSWNGDQRWTSTFGSVSWPSFASPTLAAEHLIMGANSMQVEGRDGSIYALEARSGQARWVNPSPGTLGSVAVQAGRGYFIEKTGRLKVIDLKTGADVASVELAPGQSLSTPAIDREVIIAPTAAGTVHAFDTETLMPLWTFRSGPGLWTMAPMDRTKAAVFSSPVISGRTVYIGCSDGNLYALNKSTGAVQWKYDFGVPTLSTPCVTGNTLITAAWDGNVYAFTRAE